MMTMLDNLRREILYAYRRLCRAPGLLAAIVATLAVGIGANTAVYSVVHAVLIEPPPFRAPERLALLWAHMGAAGLPRAQLAGPEVVDFRSATRTLEDIGAIQVASAALTGDGPAEQVRMGRVTWNLFEVLGVRVVEGRGFVEQDGQPSAAPPIVISWSLFQRRFGGQTDALGRRVVLDGVPVTLQGVLPSQFRLDFLVTGLQSDLQVFQPIAGDLASEHRLIRPYRVIARVRSGITIDQANQEIGAIRADLAARFPFYAHTDHRFFAAPLLAETTRDVGPMLLAVAGAVGVVLLAACVNVAGLLLARAAARRREIAVMIALGVSRARLARESIVEGLLIATAGVIAGLSTGFIVLRMIVAARPPGLDRLQHVSIDGAVWLAMLVAFGLWGLLFGAAPLVEFRRIDVAAGLKEFSRAAVRTRPRARLALVTTQIALSTILIVTAGLLVRTIEALTRVDAGFDTDAPALTFRISWPANRYPGSAEVNPFSRELESRLRSLPGVTDVAAISQVPFDDGANWAGKYFMDEASVTTGVARAADMRAVSPGALQMLGVTLLDGRWFTEADTRDGAPVVIVDEHLAARAWPNQRAVGQRLRVPLYIDRQVAALWTTVVGVVRHVRHRRLDIDGQEQVYVPFRQTLPASMAYILRTGIDPERVAADVRRVLTDFDPLLPAYDVRPFDVYVSRAMATQRFSATLVSSFAVMALALAGVGLAGLVSYSVASRRREFGVRIALGASPIRVRAKVLSETAVVVGVGVGLGLIGAAGAAAAIRALLFGVGPADLPTYGTAVALLGATGLAASWWPARAASGVNPVEALRGE